MTKSKDVVGGFDATHCSTAIQVLRLLRNAIEKEAGTAIARADNMEGVIRSQWIMKFSTFNEVLDMIDMTIKSIPTENQYENCKNFSEVCQTLFETDPQMQKFFGKDSAMKTWTLKKNGTQYVVEDENGKLVCARNNQHDAVVSALRIASETKRGAVQVVGE